MDTIQINSTTNSVRGTSNGGLYALGGATVTKAVNILNTANATAVGSGGSLTVLGGAAVSSDLIVGGNITAASLALSGNLSVAGTLTTVNMTTTNLIDTNITAGSANITNATIATARITSNLLALGNSNTLGNLFTTGGNVGIGTNTPSCLLTIQGPSAAGQTIFTGDVIEIGAGRSADGMAYIDFHTAEATYGDYSMRLIRDSGANGYTTLGHRGTGGLQYLCQDAGAQIWATSNTERMRLTADGNVGIGTSAPSSRLQVSGIYNTGTYVSIVKEGPVTWASQSIYNNTRYINCTGNAEHTKDFNVGPGGVGIGYAPPTYSASGADGLYVNGNVGINTAAPGSLLCLNGTTPWSGVLQVVSSLSGKNIDGAAFQACTDTNNIINFVNAAGSLRGWINGISASAVSYVTSSDFRLKTNIQDMPSMIDKIKELKPRTYNWIADNVPASGFVAQEVHQTFPELRLNKYADSDPENPVDEEGKPSYYGLDYGKFTPYLTKALQETIEKVQALEATNASILARLAAFEQK